MAPQFRYGFLAMATTVGIACGDASHPSAPQKSAGSALARYMDSLVTAAKSSPSDSLWAATLTGAEYVPGYGGVPTSITATTDSGTQTWQAFVLAEESSGNTSYFLWAFRDTSFSTMLITGAQVASYSVGSVQGYLILNDTLVSNTFGVTTITTTAVGDPCTLTLGLANIVPFAAGSCDLGTFTASVNLQLPPHVSGHGIAPGDSLVISAQPLTGVILK
jgi:hypothetical protein